LHGDKIEQLIQSQAQKLNIPIQTFQQSNNYLESNYPGISIIFNPDSPEPVISNETSLVIGLPVTKETLAPVTQIIQDNLPKLAHTYHQKHKDQLKKLVLSGIDERKNSLKDSVKQAEYTLENLNREVSRIKIMREFFARRRIKYIQEVTPSVLEDFLSMVIPNHKPKTRKNYITLLKTVLNKAVEWKLILSNPVADFKIPKTVKTFHFFGVEEIRFIISEAEEPLKTAIIILVNTGLRRAELYHLRWKDLDLINGTLRVWPYSGFTPKGKRPRSIPISASLLKTLGPLSNAAQTSDFVYRPYKNMNTLYHHFKRSLKKLGLSGTLHDLRHTFASHLSMAGVPIPVIKELMGHSDIATTMIYAHLSPSTYKEAISKLDFQVRPK
jgi:integrase